MFCYISWEHKHLQWSNKSMIQRSTEQLFCACLFLIDSKLFNFLPFSFVQKLCSILWFFCAILLLDRFFFFPYKVFRALFQNVCVFFNSVSHGSRLKKAMSYIGNWKRSQNTEILNRAEEKSTYGCYWCRRKIASSTLVEIPNRKTYKKWVFV